MPTIHEPARETPIVAEKDVVVIGSGPAGIAAAISAAREGASVMLVEQYGVVGGMMTGGLMPSINGFRNQRLPNDVQICKGVAQEVVDRLIDADGIAEYASYNFVAVGKGYACNAVPFDLEVMKIVLTRMVLEAGVELMLHTYAVDAVMDGQTVKGVIVQNKSGRQAILAKCVVDTADGDIAAAAGAPFDKAEHGPESLAFRASIMYRLANVHPERWGDQGGRGVLIKNTLVSWGGNTYADGTDAKQLTRGEVEAREETLQVVEEMKKKPGFEDSWLVQTAEFVGIRETRRFICEHMITNDEAVGDVRFEDTIGMSVNPAPRWKGQRFFFPHLGFDMPYRCLVPKGVEGVLVSGRCVSAEQLAWQSLRNQCGCFVTGQAAGVAAALAARQGIAPRNVNIKELQTHLRAQNVVLER